METINTSEERQEKFNEAAAAFEARIKEYETRGYEITKREWNAATLLCKRIKSPSTYAEVAVWLVGVAVTVRVLVFLGSDFFQQNGVRAAAVPIFIMFGAFMAGFAVRSLIRMSATAELTLTGTGHIKEEGAGVLKLH